jgi:hypothetical protein
MVPGAELRLKTATTPRKFENRKSAMRKIEASGWTEQNPSRALTRGLRLAIVALGIGLVMATGAARAGDDDDDKSFEDKIIGGIIAGIGGTNMDNRGIDYRERSPLVVPPKLDLPPPAAASDPAKVANWPKDPDESRRKKAIAERKKITAKYANEEARSLTPDELNVGRGATASRDNDPSQPGAAINNSPISPSQLGFDGSLSTLFGSKTEVAKFKGEPTRESLTQPPVGYQTPSPNYAYGLSGKEAAPKVIDTVNGKYGD